MSKKLAPWIFIVCTLALFAHVIFKFVASRQQFINISGVGKILIDSKELDLSSTHVSDLGLKELATLSKLTYLKLSNSQLTDLMLATLRQIGLFHALANAKAADNKRPTTPEEVTTLDLGGTKVSDTGLKELAPLTNLTTLSLRETKVTDVGLKELAPLTKLTELYLSDTQVSDEGLKELATLTKLNTLYLGWTKVSDEGVAELREALPNCRIIR